MSRKLQFILPAGVAAIAILWLMARQDAPEISRLPQLYDIDALNAQIAAMPEWKPPTNLEEHRQMIIGHMRDYLKTGAATYSEQHVAKCDAILSAFITQAQSAETRNKRDQILSAVKSTVTALNELNRQCDQGLIETMER